MYNHRCITPKNVWYVWLYHPKNSKEGPLNNQMIWHLWNFTISDGPLELTWFFPAGVMPPAVQVQFDSFLQRFEIRWEKTGCSNEVTTVSYRTCDGIFPGSSKIARWRLQIILLFSPLFRGKIPILTHINIFQLGWNHKLVSIFL